MEATQYVPKIYNQKNEKLAIIADGIKFCCYIL